MSAALPLPELPRGTTVMGEILDDYSAAPDLLSSSMLLVELPGGVGIGVGWSPRFDPKGRFRIVVFRGDFDNQLGPPISAKRPREVVERIRELVGSASTQTKP